MAFWVLLPVLTLLAAAFVVVPPLRWAGSAGKSETGRGTILALVIGLAAVVVIPASILYAYLGRPDLASERTRVADATGGTTPASAEHGMQNMIQHLRNTVQRDPTNGEAWQNLGWAYMHIRRPDDAVKAYRHAVSLAPDNDDYLSALAESEVQAGNGRITQAMLAEFKRAAAGNPADARARFYLGLYKDQQGDHRGAIADWIALIKSAPANAAWAPEVRSVVERVAAQEHLDVATELPSAGPPEVASGPTPDQVAAAQQMTAGDRNAMIQGMVDRLTTQLHRSPHDAGGWQRLMRARVVLGEKDKALAAYQAARSAFALEPAQLTALDNTARGLGIASR